MPVRRLLAPVLVVALGLPAGCSDGRDAAAEPVPRLGGPAPTASAPPAEPMDQLETPVAERLAARLQDDGLTLEHVDCPGWSGALPHEITCDLYVDGVVGEVEVALSEGQDGRVEFDAWLGRGVVATARLVERLEAEGYSAVDCGTIPAYPARPGTELVCRVRDGGGPTHVVATVTDRRGEVRIEDY